MSLLSSYQKTLSNDHIPNSQALRLPQDRGMRKVFGPGGARARWSQAACGSLQTTDRARWSHSISKQFDRLDHRENKCATNNSLLCLISTGNPRQCKHRATPSPHSNMTYNAYITNTIFNLHHHIFQSNGKLDHSHANVQK